VWSLGERKAEALNRQHDAFGWTVVQRLGDETESSGRGVDAKQLIKGLRRVSKLSG
jgi:hypothetical protein